ncbi:MAG: response regulator [Granulosicoccus sp.]
MSSTYTVMIVDDNSEDRYILKRYLEKTELPLVLLEVSSGMDGIELLTTPVVQLEKEYPGISAPVTLFLDINMPLMNGWEFVEELELQSMKVELRPTVVLMYSTSADKYDKDKATQYKTVSNYIVKGESTPEMLKNAILSNHA